MPRASQTRLQQIIRAAGGARSKYSAEKVRLDGHLFDSKAEARRYRELMLMQTAGAIRDLSVHPSFNLEVNRELVARYEADFSYFDVKADRYVYEDVKGARRGQAYQLFRLKAKLMKACHGIEVQEINAR